MAAAITPTTETPQPESNRNQLFPAEDREYELTDEIGKGATATVYTAKILKRNLTVAVKKINLERFCVNIDELLKEIQVMSQCNHENVVKFYTSFVVKHDLWLIMEMLDGGSLLDVIRYTMATKKCTNGVLDEVAISTVLKEVLKGLDYFHSNGHIHRDIKAGNILLSLEGAVKIADFGVSAFIASSRGDNTKEASRHTFVGTPCWMAPEVMSHTPEGYNTRADIWSFGILALELATGKAPYHMYPPVKVLVMTLQSDPPTLETCEETKDQYKHYSKQFRKFIECCLQKNPQDRLPAKQLLKNDIFKKAKDKAYIARNLSTDSSKRLSIDNDRPPSLCSRTVRQSFDGEWYFDEVSKEEMLVQIASGDATTSNSQIDPSMLEIHNAPKPLVENETSSDGLRVDLTKPVFYLPDESQLTTPMPQENEQQSGQAQSSENKESIINVEEKMKLTLRLRNKAKQLNDIKFDFDLNKDTCEIVAEELVTAGLIEGQDRIVVAFNMAKVIEDPEHKSVVFAMPSLRSDEEEFDMSKLIGCAMWINKHVDDDSEL